MPDIGYYTLPVIPSFRGTEARLGNQLNRTFGKAGTDAGNALTKAASTAIKNDKAIETATAAKSKALDRLADSMGRARTAEASLSAARTSGNQARIVAAEERFATARRRTTSETLALTSATKQLDGAIKTAKANAESAAQNDGGSGGGAMGLMLLGRGGAAGLSRVAGSAGSTAGAAAGTAMKAGIAGVLTVGAVAAIFAPIMAGVKLFSWGAEVGLPLDRAMNNMKAVTNATGAEMASAGAEARRLGADTQLAGTTASTAADAMSELAKSGFSVDQAVTAARGTVQLSTAANIDAADAALYVGSAINTFQLRAEDAARVTNDLAAAANSSSIEIPDLALALQQGGSVAGGFGMSLEDTIATLATFAQMGVRGSDAGTLMKTSLLATLSPTEKQTDAIAALNLHLQDANGNFVGYREMMNQLSTASKTMTQDQFNTAAATIYGTDAVRASMFAAGNAVPIWDKMRDAQNDQTAASRMAAAQMRGLPGVIEGVSNTVDSMKLAVYDAGNAIMTALGQQALGGLNSLAEAVRRHQPQIVGFFTGVGTFAIDAAQQILKFAEYSVDAIAGVVNVFGDFQGGILRAGAAIKRLTGDTAGADEWDRQADAAFGYSDGLEKIVTGLHKAGDDLQGFKGKLQAAGDQANEAAKLTVALANAVTTVPDGKDIIITNNTPETIADLHALGIEVEQTPTGLKMTATTDEAKRIVDAWRAQQGLEPVKLEATLDTAAAQAKIDAFFNQNANRNMPVPINPNITSLPPPTPGAPIFAGPYGHRAAGGVFGRMPTSAVIQPSKPGLVQWAEPSTKGEAFIPLGGGARSRNIWAKTGGLLGIPGFADGAITMPDVAAAMGMVGADYSQGSRTDCSGMVARVILRSFGLPEGGLMSTKNAGSWLAKYGFKPGLGGPGTISVGWYDHGPNPNDGHMAMTLSNGMHAESGGSHGDFLVGAGAKGADDAGFDQHMFLPVEGLYPQGAGQAAAGLNTGGQTGGGGYVVDPEAVHNAEGKVVDADAKVAIQEQQIKEMKADATESQKMAAQDELRRAKEDAKDARTDLAKAKQGDYKEGSASAAGGGGAGGPDVGGVGGIMSQFMKDTFGLGDLLPDPSQLGIVKLLGAIMGITYTPQGGKFPFQGGPPGQLSNPFGGGMGGGGGDPISSAMGSMFGMSGMFPDVLSPGTDLPPLPADGVHPGTGAPPGPTQQIDQSNNVTVQGYSSNDVATKVRRELQWAPRVQTYTPPGG